MKLRSAYRLLQPEERELLAHILERATYNRERPMLSLGDEPADRLRSDEIILRVFDVLENHGVKCNVLESNHGMEFSKFYHHCRKQTLSDWKLFECFTPEYAPSLIAFEEAIVRGDIDKEEAEALMKRHLQRKRLLDAHLDDLGILFLVISATQCFRGGGDEDYPVLTCLDRELTGKSLNYPKGAVIWTSHLDSHSLDMRMRLASNPGASTRTFMSPLLHQASGSRTMKGYGSIPSSPNEHRDDPDKERTSGWCCCCRR